MANSLLMLLNDIATVLDDVALLTKVAAKKTAGVLGDDLALNAQQVSVVRAERELPVVWAVCKGSLINKAILVPGALLLSAVAPWAITPLLMAASPFMMQFTVLAGVALLMTVGVYGLVAGIVKIDDLGLYLRQRTSRVAQALQQKLGRGLLLAAPLLMKSLTVLGTLAMFLVGGGILAHGWHDAGQGIEQLSAAAGSTLQPVLGALLNMTLGLLAGGVALLVVTLGQRLRR
jgi:predicted DNA repair protein MutK